MPSSFADASALEQTLSLYGDVLRATKTFEGQAGAFLAKVGEQHRDRLEEAGVEFAAKAEVRDPYDWYGTRFCSTAFGLKRLRNLPRAKEANLVFNLGWLLAPEHDRHARPFANLEIHYGDLGDSRAVWKKAMAAVKGRLPKDVSANLYLPYFGMMRSPKGDEVYRSTLAEISGDFAFLVDSFAAALRASS